MTNKPDTALTAEQERAALVNWLRGDGGVIPGLSLFAPLVSNNPMPDMSGDNRNRLTIGQRRSFDRVIDSVCEAIERGDHHQGKLK